MAATAFGSGRALMLVGALLVTLNPISDTVASVTTNGLSPRRDKYNNTICKSQDIRNTLESFKSLEGCEVVEGFVQILLFDNVNESAFDMLSFPELREITDFLLLYRVNGLKTLEKLFPNLAVIRGQEKVFGYSFVIYEMSSLQEIGLYSLTSIVSGLIRIDKNPSLCYVNSIDWNRIAHEKGEHYIKNMKDENECPLCPGDDDSSEMPCNVSDSKNGIVRHLCWNRQHCQKICPPGCLACDSKGRCCDEKCLGGCSEDNSTKCHVCKDYSWFGECLNNCPPNYLEYLGRRCISESDCKIAPKPLKLYSKIMPEHPYKIFNNTSCVLECPSEYTAHLHTCEPCHGRCQKVCQGAVIDSIDSAKHLHGCTHINGSMEIQIRGGSNVVNKLEENLNKIEEIFGYLKIVRSFPLVSLDFFKRLNRIRGQTLESQKYNPVTYMLRYVFIVLDNQNLQDIWDWRNRTLKIDRGRLFFHFNPRLCLNKIVTLKQKANLSNFTNLEVAPNSNGDKVACDVRDLNVTVQIKHSKSIVLEWDQFKMMDQRKLLGYVVYYIQAPYRNVTLYDGRNACGGDGWMVDDVPIMDDNNNSTTTKLLSHLKPYTQYAFYVKTYTIASANQGAQSQIYYVRTKPDQPSLPTNLNVKTNGSDQFEISWGEPNSPNGNVTYYIVTGERTKDNTEQLKNRDFCSASRITANHFPTLETEVTTKTNNTCECKESSKGNSKTKLKDPFAVQEQISFEDKLYNFVYVKRTTTKEETRRKRETEFPKTNIFLNMEQGFKNVKNETDENGNWKSFHFRVEGKRFLRVTNLTHFTFYQIKVYACRNKEDINDTTACSKNAFYDQRTEKQENANMIKNISVGPVDENGNTVVRWVYPPAPNGIILAIDIQYGLEVPNSTPFDVCVKANTSEYRLEKLNPGKYSIRLRARSVANSREWSEPRYFYVSEANTKPTFLIIFIVAFCFLVLTIAFYIFKRRCSSKDDMKLIALVNPEYVSTVYEPDDWEVQRDKIKLIKELGQGSFGMVYEGVAKDIKGKALTRCAIKTVNEHATNRERIEFLNEASVMKAFDTAHVVRLLGVVSQGQPTLVVMELMANGDLKSYLRSHRPDVDSYEKANSKQPPTLKRILQMAIEIADGMAYLSAKKFVHRDLAARNCMVAEDLTVKIGDFGMTRDIYETDYYRKGTKGLLPVRWMAPESLKDGVFTSSSDVWSYGVVLWEMATLASQPYQGLSNDQVLRYVIDGGIMEKPENCPDKLYNLMRCCWRHKPSDRPSFLSLCSLLLEDACQSFSQISFFHSAAGMEARNSRPSQSPSQDDASTPLRRAQINEHYSLSSSDDSDHEQSESNIDFNNYASMTKDISSAANGYVSTRASNSMMT